MKLPEKEPAAAGMFEQVPNFWDMLAILRKRWLIIVSVFICVAFIGIYKTYQKIYLYTAQAKMAFTVPESQLLSNSGGVFYNNNEFGTPVYLSTQMQIIKSEPVARRVVESLNLAQDPQKQSSIDAAIAQVQSSLNVQMSKDSQIMLVSAVSHDPDRAMKIANTTAEAYIRYNEDKRYQSYRKSMGGITEQLADLEKKLEESQKDLITYIEKENITSYGDTAQPSRTYQERDDEREARGFIESLNNQEVGLEIERAKLLEKYYENHPKVEKLKNDIKILNSKIEEQQKRLASLRQNTEKEIIEAKQKEIRYGILKRKVEVNKQIYDTLSRKLKETDIGSEMHLPYVDIIEYARKPVVPFTPDKKKEAVFSIILGILLGIAAGAALQFTDSSFKNVEELENYVKYPVLSTVPLFKRKGNKKSILVSLEQGNSDLKEAFRLLRTNLKFAFSEKPGKLLVITSSQKGEGKSTVTANLGFTMADAGAKTLLVDADLRVRSLKYFFGLEAGQGLSDYLSKDVEFDSIVNKTDNANLFVITSGPNVDNPAVLFESEKMKTFFAQARERFDYVLVDAPPVGYVIDGSILSMLADGVLVIVEAGVVGRKAVVKAIDQLMKGKSHIYGIIFNKEALSKQSYYYKYYRYYSSDKEKSV